MRATLATVLSMAALAATPAASGAPPEPAECIAPAKPGGGFDLTCQLAQAMLRDARQLQQPLRISYMPGGIGAVAYNVIVQRRPAEPGTLVAFSGGSLLNIAQGKFGSHGVDDVRWLAIIGADHGAIAVRRDSPWRTLKDLESALRADPNKVVFGAGGTVGSQDWMKAALVARAAGVGHKAMRFVAFEGGGDALAALQGGHVHVMAGDAGEFSQQIEAGAQVRIIAVLADKRLPGRLAEVPTAREQGHDIRWPIVRGFYLGPKVSEADYHAWTQAFSAAMRSPEFAKLREQKGLYPFSMTGGEVDSFVKSSVLAYRKLAEQFGLPVAKR